MAPFSTDVTWLHFNQKRVGVRGPRGEFSLQPVYPRGEFSPQKSTEFSQKWPQRVAKYENSQILPNESGSKRKYDTQQEYAWHLNTQPEGVCTWGEKRGSKRAAHPYWL